MTIELLMSVIKTFGLPVALLLFMLWQDNKRKEQDRKDRELQLKRIQDLEDYQKGEMARVAVESATALQNSVEVHKEATHASREIANSMRQLTLAIRTRPCLEQSVDVMEQQKEAS